MGNDITAGHTWADTETGKRVDVENLNRAFSDAALKEGAISARALKSPVVLSDSILITDGALKKTTLADVAAITTANPDAKIITDRTAETVSATDDSLLVYDLSATALRKMTRDSLFKTAITTEVEETAIADDDALLVYDASAAALRKTTRYDMIPAGSFPADNATLTISGPAYNEVIGIYQFTATAWRNATGLPTAAGTILYQSATTLRSIAPFNISGLSQTILGLVQAQNTWNPGAVVNTISFALDADLDA
jgi:hypothetical protein